MVDCRLCKNHHKIYGFEEEEGVDKYVCMAKEVFLDIAYLTKGPCDLYDDVDGYDTEE